MLGLHMLLWMAIFPVGVLFGWMTCALFSMNPGDDYGEGEDDGNLQG